MGIANEDETKLALTGYVRVTNASGELYDNADTRLVVGKINLVEKIAELARRPPPGTGNRCYRRTAGSPSKSDFAELQKPSEVREASNSLASDRSSLAECAKSRSSSRASPNTSSSPSKAAKTSRTRNPSG